MNKKMWVTKYWATKGIYQGDFEISGCGKYAKSQPYFLKIGVDCFPDMESALEYAQEAARKRIASLKKQIAKIEKLAMSPKFAKEKP